MICQRCGNCCIHLDIYIINPTSVLPDGTIDTGDPSAMIHKPAGERCPHLAWENNQAACVIHHLPCYQGTPCQLFEQVGSEDAVCIMSSYFKGN
ncbi:MAG: hypothetical protein A4E44_00974 [Methanosaeta sp. PtaB.Bin018]|jgi:hypothetical protein|nr:hypothetical protein [Methanothrix sp.]OPX75984.1 MAG: hypothetical protein A4E44_00974 [Methanosaeta sp. PtaB.Bin018]OPY43830.1 MAG: hypothetical protein A4E46_01626 [Methanosaeta sp. PtaU1.Bin016]